MSCWKNTKIKINFCYAEKSLNLKRVYRRYESRQIAYLIEWSFHQRQSHARAFNFVIDHFLLFALICFCSLWCLQLNTAHFATTWWFIRVNFCEVPWSVWRWVRLILIYRYSAYLFTLMPVECIFASFQVASHLWFAFTHFTAIHWCTLIDDNLFKFTRIIYGWRWWQCIDWSCLIRLAFKRLCCWYWSRRRNLKWLKRVRGISN